MATNTSKSFYASMRVQLRVLGALLMREIITRYGRDNLGFLWLFFEPMLFTVGVTALWTASNLTHGSTLPIAAFALTGYSSVLLWRNCANRASMAIPPNISLLYHRNVRVLDLFVARIALEIAGASISFFILSVILISAEWIEPPSDILQVLVGWFFLAWFGGALALIIGALAAYSEIAERLWHPIAYLLFPISGAAFMVEWLPAKFQEFVLLLPMVNGVEMLREGYFGSSVHTRYDTSYVFVFCLLMTLVGFVLVRDAGRRVEVE